MCHEHAATKVVTKTGAALAFVGAGLLFNSSAYADQHQPMHKLSTPGLHLKLTTETVGDSVAYSPNLLSGGFAEPQKLQRYASRKVAIDWIKNDQLTLQGEYSRLRITSLRDQIELNRITFGSLHTLAGSTPQKRTVLNFKVTSNFTDSIYKNSYTQINDNQLSELTINRPNDLVVQTGFTHSQSLFYNSQWSVFTAFGHIRSKHQGISGNVFDGACNYQFNFDAQGGQINQLNPCGDIQALSRIYPDDNAVEQDLGISPNKDTTYNATFLMAGAGFSIKRNRWQANFSFNHQLFSRPSIDTRINSQGNTSYESNQVVSAEISHATTAQLSFSAKLEYNRHQFLDSMPVLYSSVTAHRFENAVVFLALQARYSID